MMMAHVTMTVHAHVTMTVHAHAATAATTSPFRHRGRAYAYRSNSD
jgi:hypothetical protein